MMNLKAYLSCCLLLLLAACNDKLDLDDVRSDERLVLYCIERGKSIGELQFWQSTGGTIVAIRRGQTVILSPGPYAELYSGDVIILVGSPSAAEAAHRLVTTKE